MGTASKIPGEKIALGITFVIRPLALIFSQVNSRETDTAVS